MIIWYLVGAWLVVAVIVCLGLNRSIKKDVSKQTSAVLLAALLAFNNIPVAAQGTGSVSGAATGSSGAVLSGTRVQLRNVDTGQVAGNTTSGANGGFSFTGLNAGNYVVEIVDATGRVIGVSASMPLSTGGTISGVTVAASAAGALAGAAAAGGLGTFFTSTGGILVLVGVGATAMAGIHSAMGTASPSK